MRKLAVLALMSASCTGQRTGPSVSGGATSYSGGIAGSGGDSDGGGTQVEASGGALPKPEPRYHPPPGFEGCEHAEVKADCKDGWCRLPPSCFVMGSPEDEWYRGKNDEAQTAVQLSHHIEVQQKELTRAEWESITKVPPPGPAACEEAACPVAMVSWWDAIQAADLFSDQNGKQRCYEPQDCRGTLGKDLTCAKVKDPTRSVYECSGYRLLTRTEAEYASRAGTISTFYSGDITVYSDTMCREDPALSLIGWYCMNSGGRPHIGGELRANGFGLYDMVGNLVEWRNDELDYSSSPGGIDPRGAAGSDVNRTFSLGQYDGQAVIARSAGFGTGPSDTRGNQGGFRLVRTLDPKP
jgi:formylglycine-generating enzyme